MLFGYVYIDQIAIDQAAKRINVKALNWTTWNTYLQNILPKAAIKIPNEDT